MTQGVLVIMHSVNDLIWHIIKTLFPLETKHLITALVLKSC